MLAAIVSLCSPASAYVRLKAANGTFLQRPDFASVQMLLNNQAVPGLQNANGQTWVTPDSDLAGALSNAMAAWNSVPGSAAQFAPAQPTVLTAAAPGTNVIALVDTPATRSALGPYTLAFTANTYYVGGASDGAIATSFVYLNPVLTFSTTNTPGSYDLQSVFTHELGHVLGANHTGAIGAAMFQSLNINSAGWQKLTPDDMAFAANVYPAALSGPAYGSIGGTLSGGGSPLRSALVNAVDTVSGAVFSAVTNGVDGTYSIAAPPSNYYLFAQPITGAINYNFYLCVPGTTGCTVDNVDTGFQNSFLGGNSTPSVLAVTAGNVTNGDFSPPLQAQTLAIQYINTASAGGFGDQSMLLNVGAALPVPSGGQVDIIVVGPGIDNTLTDANVMLVGPLTLQPGSVRADGYALSNGWQFIRMTVNVAAVTTPTDATLVLSSKGNVAAFPAGLILLPPAPAGQ